MDGQSFETSALRNCLLGGVWFSARTAPATTMLQFELPAEGRELAVELDA